MSEIWLALAASVIINLVIVLFFYRTIRRKTQRLKQNEHDEQLSRLRSEVSDLITDVNHIVNGNLNVIEDKTQELKRLTNEANKRIMKLNSLITDTEIVIGRATGAGENVLSNRVASDRVASDRVAGDKVARDPVVGDRVAGARIEVASSDDGERVVPGRKYDKVLELYNLGLDVVDISRKTNLDLAEIKQMLSLYRS